MCAVSMVYDMGRRDWPYIQHQPHISQYDYMKTWLEMVEKAKKLDEINNQPDCEDPAKEDVLKQILTRLEEIEKKVSL